jgi:hypothetical protein
MISEAITALGVTNWQLQGTPTTEVEFNEMFYKVVGVDNDGVTVLSNNPNDFGVTWEEVSAKASELQAEYDAAQYQRDRAEAYPSIGDQLDMIFHAGLGGDEFQAAIQAVKDANPKPE